MRKNMLITSIIIILISSLIMNVSAENLTELSTNDLFIKYPYYLNNTETNEIIRNATDTYNNVMSDYDENDEFISAIKNGVSSSVEVIIRDIGSKLGLVDSYYETCMDAATIELMQTLYSDENLIAGMNVVKKTSKILEDVRTVSEITAVKSCEIAAALENLSESEVLAMTEELVENSGDILDSVEDAANMAKYIYTACIITDVQLEMIDVLMERVDKNGELYEGLSRLRHKMSYNIVEYTGLTFIKNKGLAHIADTVTKLGLNSLGISTGPFLIGQIIAKTAVWVMFDIIYPHPGADEVISNMIHSMYVMELETSLMNQRLAFNEPFYVSDMEAYETFFTVYLAAVKTTLESTKALAKEEYIKQRLEIVKQNLASALPNYEGYINKCKKEVLSTSEEERIIRTEQAMTVAGTAAIGEDIDVKYHNIVPLTSDGSTYWNLNVSGKLVINGNASVPYLSIERYGVLELNKADLIVEGDLYNDGIMRMEHDEDYILVKGNYRHDRYQTSNITAGTLEIKGDVYAEGYKPTGIHKTVLSGNAKQSISYARFNTLELANTSEDGISFSDAYVTKELYSNGGLVNRTEQLKLSGNAKICSEWKNAIGLSGWQTEENITFEGAVYIYNGVSFNHNVTVKGTMELDGEVNSGNHSSLTLNDMKLTVPYLSIERQGILNLNNARITVEGDLYNDGIMRMKHDEDYILVKGNYIHGRYQTSNITAGTLEIKGDVYAEGYKPTGIHKTVLSGNAKQSISYARFNTLELANTSEDGISFSDAYVTKELYSNGGLVNRTEQLKLSGNAKICSEWKNAIGLSGWQTEENITFEGAVYIYNGVSFNHNVTVKGTMELDGEVNSGNHSSLTLNDMKLTVPYLSIERQGILNLNNARITVEGDLYNDGIMRMEHDEDYILVKGNYRHDRYRTSNITAGTLEIKGDVYAEGYKPTGTHKTVLSGNAKQSISYARFNTLELANTSEEGISFLGTTSVSTDITQPIGTKITGSSNLKLQNKPAFVDYGELNSEINRFNGNAENVIPTWLDYERYCKFALDGNKAFTLNESITDTTFACDMYFSIDYNKTSAVVIVAFYDDNRFVQMASKPVEVKAGKIDVLIDYENKPYSKYKIMVWESFDSLTPLMAAK